MKIYEVELKRTGYVVISVEAANPEDAEMKAWDKLATNADSWNDSDGNWEVEGIEEQTA
jgi:hypothetical protein